MDKLDPLASDLLPNKDRFLSEYSDNRNAVAHQSWENKKHVLGGMELFVLTNAVHLLGYAGVLCRLGITADAVKAALERSGYMSDAICRARNQYAVEEGRKAAAQ